MIEERGKEQYIFSANARLTNHTGADLVAIPPSWEVVTKQKIAESRRKLNQTLSGQSSWISKNEVKVDTLLQVSSNSYIKIFTTETREWSQQLRADIDTLVCIAPELRRAIN